MVHRYSQFTVTALIICSLFFFGCDNSQLAGVSQSVNDSNWHSDQPVDLKFPIDDTSSKANFYLLIRHTNEYPYSNLYIFLTTYFPNNKKSVDTINCPMADASGKWFGSGIGGTYDNKILYQRGKKLPLPGMYEVQIQQAMRDTLLKGIIDVGIAIEKTDN